MHSLFFTFHAYSLLIETIPSPPPQVPTSLQFFTTKNSPPLPNPLLISVKLTSKPTTVHLISHHFLLGLPSSLPLDWINVVINFQFPTLCFNTVDSAGIPRHHSMAPYLSDHPFSISIGEFLISFQILNIEVSKVQDLKKNWLRQYIKIVDLGSCNGNFSLHSLLNSDGSNHLTISEELCKSFSYHRFLSENDPCLRTWTTRGFLVAITVILDVNWSFHIRFFSSAPLMKSKTSHHGW